MNESRPKSDIGFVAIITACAFAIRAGYWAATQRAIDMADAIHYIRLAQQFAGERDGPFDENLPVLYSAFGALAHLAIPDWEIAFRVVSLVASTLLIPIIYLTAREMFDVRTARLAAAVTMCWPWLVDYGSRIAPQSLYVTLWFAGAWTLMWAMRRGGWRIGVPALVFFCLHLCRPEGTFLLIASPLAAWWLVRGRESAERKGAATYAIGALGGLAIYALAMKFLIGTATVSYRAPMAQDLGDYFQRGLIPLGKTFLRLNFDLFPVMLGPVLLVFLGIGIYMRIERPGTSRLGAILLFFAFVQWGLTMANFSPAPRYIMVVVIALSLWSCFGAISVMDRLRPRGWAVAMIPLAFVFAPLGIGLSADLAAEYLSPMPRTPREYRAAGEWMRTELPPGVIVSRKPQVGFYADMPTIGPGETWTAEELLEAAAETGARYYVIDERYSAGLTPGLAPLLDSAVAPPELRALRDDLSPYEGAKIVVYEFTIPGVVYADAESFEPGTSHMGPDERRRVTDEAE